MLHLLDQHHNPIGTFETYECLIDYIHKSRIYKLRLLIYRNYSFENVLDLEETRWRFVHYKHAELSVIYSCMKEPPIKGIEKQAFDQGLDLIEVYQGSPTNPLQIPVTPDLNIQKLQKDWCESYCKAHGYSLLYGDGESTDEDSAEPQTTGDADD